jgi:hypothetical protein
MIRYINEGEVINFGVFVRRNNTDYLEVETRVSNYLLENKPEASHYLLYTA